MAVRGDRHPQFPHSAVLADQLDPGALRAAAEGFAVFEQSPAAPGEGQANPRHRNVGKGIETRAQAAANRIDLGDEIDAEPVPRSAMTMSGRRWTEVRMRTGPASGSSIRGLSAVAYPIKDPAGQSSAANSAALQGLCTWALSRNSEWGRRTARRARLASPGRALRTAWSAGFLARRVPPESRS